VASKLVDTNAANFFTQINKITALARNLPTFVNGTMQNPERNWLVDINIFLLDTSTQKISLNGTRRFNHTKASTTRTAIPIAMGVTGAGGGGGGAGGRGGDGGGAALSKRQATPDDTSLGGFGAWDEIRELLIFFYWTLNADVGQISRLSPLTNGTAMKAFDLTCSPMSCDQMASQNVQTRSIVFTNYLCSVPQPKSPLSLLIAVMVANLVLLSAGYQIIFLVASYLAKRNEPSGTPSESRSYI